MARAGTQEFIRAELERTRRFQTEAADPHASVWVSANAGTGKTHVLTMRVLRLLLAGTPPERILCLTYTKAAAAEMSKRVFDELATWVTVAGPELADALHKLMSRAPSREELARARTLFTAAIETPGGLKVQTIHAFCERLLQRFPLEAGVPPGFEILDDETARTLRREAIDDMLSKASREPDSLLGAALRTAIAYAAEDQFDEVLRDALEFRAWLASVPRLVLAKMSGLAAYEAMLRRHFGLREGATRQSVDGDLAGVISDSTLKRVSDALVSGTKTDVQSAETLSKVLAATSPDARAEALSAYFLTGGGEPRRTLMTKGPRDRNPDLEAVLGRTQDRFAALWDERKAIDVITATLALTRLADAVMQRYSEAKARRASLDFEDLIERTESLLRVRDSTEWVLYKLDGGLDHILVDESQDTSPAQWRIIESLVQEFFSGTGAREQTRTLFAVGDEKQSIYSFQGAAPEMFSKMGDDFAGLASEAGVAWRRVPLNVSFRAVEPVLRAVDTVFADRTRTPGVAAAGSAPHIASRFGRAGLVEVWPVEAYEDADAGDAWSPLEGETAQAPVVRLANRIADTIQGWLASGEQLVSENRPIGPGDILILVRKRNPFAVPMVAALKARGIPVAGSDRIALAEQIAVQDLLALGDFLTLPEDDLALAAVLKSPLFGLDDSNLMTIAEGRKGTLWKALLDHAPVKSTYADAATRLKRWRKRADFTPPYEFLASLLDEDGNRQKLLSRLGPDAADVIDELINLALTYDDGAPPSLVGFLHWVRTGTREVKRDMEHGRNEVRVMTVHGAKGLEAPIVFLPDTCSAGSGGRQAGRPLKLSTIERPVEAPAPFIWPVKGTSGLDAIAAARAEIDAADTAERMRLLYVAMTRARDRLYVAGFDGKAPRPANCWYEIISEALGAPSNRVAAPSSDTWKPVLRMSSEQTVEPDKPKAPLTRAEAGQALPKWAQRPVPREPQLSVPLAPSRLAPYETDETGEPSRTPPPKDLLAEPPTFAPAAIADENRFLRGTLTHALLEHLPSLDPATWPKAAKAFVAKRGVGLSARTQASIVTETLAVLGDKTFAPLFSSTSRAEVAIVAEIPRPRGAGPALRLTGQIDRLSIAGKEILIVDYKTNRPPPGNVTGVADVYLYQLAAYRLAIQEIYSGKTVRAAILWTDGPRIMEIPAPVLDTYAARLWQLDQGHLDVR